jgi:hypothetical protein
LPYKPNGLEGTFDPWAEQETEKLRVKMVAFWLMDLMQRTDPPKGAIQTLDDPPTYVAEVPFYNVAITWTVLDDAKPEPLIAVQCLADLDTNRQWWYFLGPSF